MAEGKRLCQEKEGRRRASIMNKNAKKVESDPAKHRRSEINKNNWKDPENCEQNEEIKKNDNENRGYKLRVI